MAHLLGAQNLRLDFGTGVVLDDVSVGLDDGDRIGVVGANGAGKSSLIRLLAGRMEPHDGRVTRARSVSVGMVDQDDDIDGDLSVIRALVGDADVHEWASDPRIRDVMAGLVPDLDAQATVSSLSGGQRRRVALARVLIEDHDVVILDEPTNHLDIEGVDWLAEHLRTRWPAAKGALVVITHDRWFLDAVTTVTWEVHSATVDRYDGGYAAYVLERVERGRIAAATEAKRQNLLRKELAWLQRGAPARTSKPKFRVDAAAALIADVPVLRDSVSLARMAAARLGKDVVTLINCSVNYGVRQVLRDVTWNIGPGERTGILGENGAGKSTLLKVVQGTVEPTAGRVKRGITVQVDSLTQGVGLLEEYEQERVSGVLKRYSAIDLADGSVVSPSQLLERFGFTSAQLKTQVSRLSGGQRRRLQLLLVLLGRPNVLILDEPSNDLDTDTLNALEDILDAWPGTLLVVSHDRYFLERVTDQQYAVVDGQLRHLPGGVEEYVRLSRSRRSSGVGTFGTGSTGDDAGAPGLTGAELRALQKEASALERKVAKAESGIASVHERMAAHDPTDALGLQELASHERLLSAERDEAEARWLELLERLPH